MQCDVVTIGTATRDLFLTSPSFKVVRDPKHLEKLGFPTGEAQCFALGGKIEVERPIATIGGGAANAAVTFRRQGFRTAAIAKIGNDSSGKAVHDDFRKEDIRSLTRLDRTCATAFSVVLLSPNGERTILNYRGASEDLQPRDIPWKKLKARWAYIAPGRIPFGLILSLVRRLKAGSTRIAMDFSKYYLHMGPRKLAPILKDLDVLHINREEASYLTRESYKDEKKIFKKLDALVSGIVAMTDGPAGVLVSDGRSIYHAGVFPEKNLVDRTGAGDAFGSGFAAGLLIKSKIKNQKSKLQFKNEKWSPEEIVYAIRLGSANATSVVEHIGAQAGILTRREFERDPRWRRLQVKVRSI